jgi:hypothetical protein
MELTRYNLVYYKMRAPIKFKHAIKKIFINITFFVKKKKKKKKSTPDLHKQSTTAVFLKLSPLSEGFRHHFSLKPFSIRVSDDTTLAMGATS